MKYVCEICGCTADNVDTMREHEKRCQERHETLVNCTAEINALISLSTAKAFGIVVEVPSEQSSKTYYLSAAELDGKKNRCVLKVKNDEATPSTDNKTKQSKKQP